MRSSLIYCVILLAGLVLIPASPVACQDRTAAQLLTLADRASSRGDSQEAVQMASQAIKKDSDLSRAYYIRAREQFRLGKVRESVEDFDRFVELQPAAEPRLWERGISYYYDGQFSKGAKQFEIYQTYDDNDVENSVWRYLCVARSDGVEKARQTLMPIENDRRVPMMQVYEMFRGNLRPEDVLSAATSAGPNARAPNRAMFYVHLYLGLFHEAQGDGKLALKHLSLAAEKYPDQQYMWDVARVHVDLLKKNGQANSKTN